MILFRVPVPKVDSDSRDVEAFQTLSGMQVLKSIDNIPGEGERLHVSISSILGYPSEYTIMNVIARFFSDGEIDLYRNLSSKPPPVYVVHLFGDVPA